ncbi:chromosome segregation protein SMC [Ruminococcus flavefaciens]|uniref:chromosome segregation protein SMC n=1 Tax=Ruminococcus flavefaciens TaxID=1265 RepID=UPI0026EDBCD0|nr:chromosome segregation protein SMC [Ruminococcus flavefaciens]
MYLKSLEIQGFKSFPDKISLTFDKGLTAVVGPNGSGKSNIGDSVRWVLGEQSTKTLRGNKMEDVIFSGTVARKPMGFAAVTLNIDNSDKTLPDMDDEVAITRKLYRSGESEYMICGKPCRLKDINELFMDTGLGRDGYSIIGQGRIAEIVGAKSSERRDIFEEAAGISKFRYKKLEAERKLTAAQENLLRLTDILSELEGRVEPLRIQSQKAEKFIKLAEERKKLEISVWVTKLDEMKVKLDELDSKILISKNEYENIENDIQREEQKIADGIRKMQESTMRADELRRKMLEEEQTSSEMKSGIAVLENDIKHCNEAVEVAQRNIDSSEEAKKALEQERKAALEGLAELEEKRKALEAEIKTAEESFERAESESSKLGDSVDKAGSEINSMYIRQSEYRFTIESSKAMIDEQTARLAELRESSSDISRKLAEYQSQTAEIKAEKEKNAARAEELRNKLSGLERLYKSRREGFEQAKNDFERALYELKDKQQRRKILTDLENNMEGFAGSVKQVLKASKQGRIGGVMGTVAQNIGVEPKYAVAVETALGGAMQNIIVENEDIAKRCIRFLKEQKGGRATFLPITSVRGFELREQGLENCEGFVANANKIVTYDQKFSGIIASLLGRIVIAEDIDTATLIAKKYGYKFKIVTLDGQVINAGGSFTGGSAQRSGGIITRKNEIDTLDAEIVKLEGERDALRERAEKLRAESEKLRFDTEAAKEEQSKCDADRVRIGAELNSLASLEEQFRAQSENSEKVTAETEQRIAAAKENIAEAEKALAETDAEIKAAEEKLAQGQDTREKLRVQREELADKLSELKIRGMELAKDVQAQELELSRIERREEELKSGTHQFEEEIKRQNKLISEKESEITELKKKLADFKDNTETYNAEIQRCHATHTEQNRLVNEMQNGLKSINDAKEKLSAEVTRLEERKETVCRDTDNIIRQLMEVYELTRSEAVAAAEKIDDMIAAQAELTTIKNKIRALGSVNVDAIEEYKEVFERYRFMSEQIADVQKSKTELEKIITDLTSEMCRIFSESFEIINSNFKSIFVELFGGGKAELILTDPENVLESGIEISVAPPGKVIKNLISLSGGEQSFVAIAIYFAILKLRPAPFCILDEIDAALDEVNVRKYAQYLKKFTDTTQFVLVTHRRSAMEEANVLYGVTMQEDGISKLLKMEQVDFQEDVADIQ